MQTSLDVGTVGERVTEDEEWEEESGTSCSTLAKPTTGRGNTQFAAETAAITGESKQNINRTLAVSNVLGGNTLDRVIGTSLDKGVELMALTKLVGHQAMMHVTAKSRQRPIAACSSFWRVLGILKKFRWITLRHLNLRQQATSSRHRKHRGLQPPQPRPPANQKPQQTAPLPAPTHWAGLVVAYSSSQSVHSLRVIFMVLPYGRHGTVIACQCTDSRLLNSMACCAV